MKHTPGLWSIRKSDLNIQFDIIADGKEVASTVTSETTDEENLANAQRIIDCVNAMDGLEFPHLYRETWDLMKHLQIDAYPKVKAKHDKLLEALKFCQSVIKSGGMFDRSEQLAYEKAEEAINNSEKED